MCYSILVENDFDSLARTFDATIDRQALAAYQALNTRDPKKFKAIAARPRIYPNDWAPIMVWQDGKLTLRPMRYRLLPGWSPAEIPSRYNLFNARLDMLQKRRSWRGVFGKRHGLVVFKAFFEWVEDETGKKKVLKFFPADQRLVVAPVLWDVWEQSRFPPGEAQDLPFSRLESFAVITGDPHPAVMAAGHDRTPIFLRRPALLPWLQPAQQSDADLLRLLTALDDIDYAHELAAA